MNLLLNASNLRHGGGKTVALQLINAVAPLRPRDKLYIIAPKGAGYESLTRHPNIAMLPLPDIFHRSWLSKLRHMHFVFPKWCERLQIDKVISLGNVAFPARQRPQAVYIQLPQLVYHESPAWKMMDMAAFLRNSLMDQYVALHMRYATSYAVQTEVMRARLIARFKLPGEAVHILPNAAIEPGKAEVTPLPEPLEPLKLLFLSRYYPHKHFECLPEVARLLQERGLPVEITLTISKDEAPGAAKVLQALRQYPAIRNIGPIPIRDVGSTVAAHHGIFLPSLMESFSGAYAEALLHRRLIFTSHYDFASELLGDAAFYFDPLKPEHIVSVLEAVAGNKAIVTEKLAAIEARACSAQSIGDVARSFSRIIDNFV
jgi:glycosyltransferase involved in cell wall biosynthesis